MTQLIIDGRTVNRFATRRQARSQARRRAVRLADRRGATVYHARGGSFEVRRGLVLVAKISVA